MNVPTNLPFVSKVASSYVKATQGLQNYGGQIAKRVKAGQSNVRDTAGKVTPNYYKGINPFPNPFKAGSYKKP